MGKRHTAKTGDKGIYKSREDPSEAKAIVDDDDMYNEVDRYNNAKEDLQDDMLKFGEKDESEEEGFENDVEGVFDLGLGQSDDESDSSEGESSSSSDEEESRPTRAQSDDDDDSSIEGGFDLPDPDILNWGIQKKDYYHGDTADLEIGQEIEDAELEEEAGKEVLKTRLEGMTEDDFMLDDDDDSDNDDPDEPDESKTSGGMEIISDEMPSTKRRKLSNLSKKDKIKLMSKTHPELLPLVSHFRDNTIQPCADKTLVAVNALLESKDNAEAVGATSNGLKYLLTKAMLQTATALNVCQYLMIKADQAVKASDEDLDDLIDDQQEDNIKNHPVISRLNQLNHLSEKLDTGVESNVSGLKDQLDNLVKASTLMTQGDESEQETSDEDEEVSAGTPTSEVEEVEDDIEAANDPEDDDSSNASSSDEEDGDAQRRILNEARFALRKQDDEEDMEINSSSKRRNRRSMPVFSDFGDEDAGEAEVTAASRKLASTINKISQKSKPGKKSAAPEVIDDDEEEKFSRGLAMMKADLGDDDFDDNNEVDNGISNEDDEEDDDDLGDDFYSQIKKKSKDKKALKKSIYQPAPKYPNIAAEIEGERAIGAMIMKNRGLVAHKAKINRNPRVKKREQYRKALIRRKGAVREVRTDEVHKYGGEGTGIRSGLSRSRKLGVK